MTRLLRSAILALCLAILAGCASGGIPKWRHFHGNLPGQGYIPVESGYALSSAWTVGPYKITTSSPVIGVDRDGRKVIYFGTVDGELVAINSEDGNERWRRSFDSGDKTAQIVSTPAISRNGDVYVITNHPLASRRFRSVLHKVDEFSKIRWSFTFADDGFTSGSPKVLKWGADTLIFVYVTAVVDGDPQGELLVFRDNGKTVDLLDRKALGRCEWGSAKQPASRQDVFDSFAAVWDSISVFPVKAGDSGNDLPDGFVDPTAAVFTDRTVPLIAIADNLCSIGAFEWDDKLSVIWREFHPFEKHSSTMLLPNGMMVFGRQDGKTLAYHMETGAKLWEHNAGQPVFATPAAAPGAHIFIVAKDQIKVLHQADGSPVFEGGSALKVKLPGQTFASPAVSRNCVYVPAGALLSFSHDLSTRSEDTNFSGNGLTSVALENSGAVYAVAGDGTIRKYLGPK
jgi:outer membrane protein assembly factor BamB